MNYEQDIYIDQDGLDIECLDQAKLMLKYTRLQASAKKEVSRMKEALAVEKAELGRRIRKDPDDFDLDKVTEAVVENTIIIQPDYKRAVSDLLDAQYEYDMIRGAVEAVQQRKDMLQDLIRLHGQQYFAGPSIPRDLSYEVKQKRQKEQANAAIKIGRRRKRN